ncbi:MAG TPA: hypothetical protein VGL72_12110 [Bryobacteraceae bacterium]|jgi:hypothetical protein
MSKPKSTSASFGGFRVVAFAAALALGQTAFANNYTYVGVGGDFNAATFDIFGDPVPNTTTFVIPVSDMALIDPGDAVAVTLSGFQYPYASDLQVSLSLYNNLANPPLATADLFNQIGIVNPGDVGYDTQFGGTYSFDSTYAGDLWNTASNLASSDIIPDGAYWTTTFGSSSPDNLSYAFAGLPLAGFWVLTVVDNYPPFNGGPEAYTPGMTEWTLQVQATSTATPEPPTFAGVLLALGVIALARTRAFRPTGR